MRALRHLLPLLVLLTLPLRASAITRTVCPGGTCDFTTIGAAITAAANSDVISVGAGTYTETILFPAKSGIVIQATAGATPTWQPSGSGDPNGYCIYYFQGSTLSVSGIAFLGDGASDQGGIYWDVNSSLILTDCTFNALREAIRDGTSANNATTGVFTRCTFATPQSGTTTNSRFSFAAGLDGVGPFVFTDCTFDFSAAADAPSWGSAVTIGASTTNCTNGAQFTRCRFIGKATTAKQTIRSLQATTGISFTDCSFSGTNSAGGYIDLNANAGAVADETVTGLTIFNCTFGPGPVYGVVVRSNSGQSSNTANRNISIKKSRFFGGTAVTNVGISLSGVVGATEISDCTFRTFDATNEGAIFFTSVRNGTVSSCDFYDCDNSFGLTMSGNSENAFHNYNIHYVNNYSNGDGGDGAVIVHEFTNPTTSVQDTLFTLEGNVYENVTNVGVYVTSGGTQTGTTIANWQSLLATKALTRGGDFGALDGTTAAGMVAKRAIIGGGLVPIGNSFKGVN